MPDTTRRTAWYFHGFDPATTARYRRIFEAAAGPEVTVGDLPDGDGWQAVRGGTVTDVRYLRYDDLVRAFRGTERSRREARRIETVFRHILDGTFLALGRAAPRALALSLAPSAVVLAGVVGVFWLGSPHWLAGILTILFLLPAFVYLTWRYLFLDIVSDLFVFMRLIAADELPAEADLPARCHAFADTIADTIAGAEPADDTLLVGHSLGGIAAILTLAEVLEHWPERRPIHLLTLGSTHGIVLLQRGPGRDRLAAAIRRLTTDARVFWVDVSSPRDAFCVPLTDPLTLIEDPAGVSPRVISTRLARAPRIPGDRRTVFAAMRRHMGYLLRAEPGSGFDYVDTVTGARSLRARFVERNNSPRARMWRR